MVHGIASRAIALGLALMAASGCSPSVSTGMEDARLLVEVRTRLANDVELGPQPVEVRVTSRVVELSGRVETDAQAARAVTLARGVAGVEDVRSSLTVQPAQADARVPRRYRPRRTGGAAVPDDTRPQRLALGGTLNFAWPVDDTLKRATAVGPAVLFRPRQGLGPVVAFGWYGSKVAPQVAFPGAPAGEVSIRPIMAGLSYGAVRGRLSADVSIVAGLSFNGLSVGDSPDAEVRAIDVNNSLAWRPGVRVAYRLNRRLSAMVFGGYLITRPVVTFIDRDRLFERRIDADAVLVRAGLAFWIF